MEIKLRNIGIVREASIKLDGLTVITGKNESGKTTVGKALYALLNAISNLKEKAEADKNDYIRADLLRISFSSDILNAISELASAPEMEAAYPFLSSWSHRQIGWGNLTPKEFAQKVQEELTAFQGRWETDLNTVLSDPMLGAFLQQFKPRRQRRKSEAEAERKANEKALQTVRSQITADLRTLKNIFRKIDKNPEMELLEYLRASVNRSLDTEFSGQIQPVNRHVKSSSIELSDGDVLRFDAEIQDNRLASFVSGGTWVKKAYFVDTPSVLEQADRLPIMPFSRQIFADEGDMDSFFNPDRAQEHAAQLRAVLARKPSVLKEAILNRELSDIKQNINAVVPGAFAFSPRGNDYIMPDGNKLRVSNMAAGSKMFSIMKLLLENGLLDENTALILDEPEIHLHPQWQNQLAEIVSLLVKELHVTVLLTTHSPNFTLALDAYMRKYGIGDATNFYQARRTENGYAEYERVNDRMEVIYQDFLKYLSEMRLLRDSFDNPGEEWEWDNDEAEGGDGET